MRKAGHRTELLCEIDDGARAVLRHRFPNVELRGDVASVDEVLEADVLTAGFPCRSGPGAVARSCEDVGLQHLVDRRNMATEEAAGSAGPLLRPIIRFRTAAPSGAPPLRSPFFDSTPIPRGEGPYDGGYPARSGRPAAGQRSAPFPLGPAR